MRALLRILPPFQVFVWRPLGRNVKFLFIPFVRKPLRLPYIWIFTNVWWLDVCILLCDRLLYITSDVTWHLSVVAHWIYLWFVYHPEWLNLLRTTAWMQRRGVHGCLTAENEVCSLTWNSQTDVFETYIPWSLKQLALKTWLTSNRANAYHLFCASRGIFPL